MTICYGIGVESDNGYHVIFRLHAGPPNSRGFAGRLILTKDEFEDFAKKLNAEVKR